LAAVLASRTGFATPKGRSRLAKALASDKLPEPGWMEATQWMLAVTACVRSFDAAQVESHAAGFESHLEALEDRLAFSPAVADKTSDAVGAPKNDTANNTVNNAEDDTADVVVNSPRRFDPTDPGYRDLIVQIRKDLEKLAGAPVPNNPEADK